MDKTTLPAVMKMEDLINGECTISEKLDRFFKALIGGKDIRHRDGVNCHILSDSLASDAIYCVSNGTVKPSKHITLGMTVKSLTSSRKMINNLNRLGHCCNYNTLEELETEATISSVNRSQIFPPDIIQNLSLSTGVAFDNFDRYVDTLTGKDTLQDTVGIIYQNVSDDYDIKLILSSISGNLDIPLSPTKRRRTFNEEIPELPSFSHRLEMLENLTPVDNELTLPANLTLIETIDLLYLLSHFLHVPNTPMWIGFNSKIIKDTSPKQKVSYLTSINFSPTNVAVVKHTMEQAQVVGKECNQTYVQVTYDLAIAKIAFKIQSTSKPQSFHPSWFIPFNDGFLQSHRSFYK
ncbi:hypothetical protein TNIN_273081 [Trichonephila inaurata madagascariensis]|uniref:Uncharacterized protein n=1 Tax=Trichonephila inaurata madagascariensis TaxID=2747483 RepID=A0A8X6Y4V1_9ARAC|nr:hypothetical protein TNIN_91121 [Trichonephila inaurata madagascariensis]GFY64410.1 hypothetical protein TNIN_273081 [Trichonephila inaurata madagascariensis]